MPVSTEPSTFEFCRDWLVSSSTFVRDVMLAEAVSLDESRDEARARIHREEALDEFNEDEESEHTPDDPPPVANRPRCIIRTVEDNRRRAGTATWAGNGRLAVDVEVIVPEAYRTNYADDNATIRAQKFVDRKQWARRLADTIRLELHATSGIGEGATPYLNGKIVGFVTPPNDPEHEERDKLIWMGWTWDVTWD
jgi:hypothetical protein